MKPRYDELSLPISITITDGERIFRWGRTHRSHERFTRPKWDPSWRYPSSADCTTATNDGLPERARINPAGIGFPTFWSEECSRTGAHHSEFGSPDSSRVHKPIDLCGSSGRITSTLGRSEFSGGTSGSLAVLFLPVT